MYIYKKHLNVFYISKIAYECNFVNFKVVSEVRLSGVFMYLYFAIIMQTCAMYIARTMYMYPPSNEQASTYL